MNGAIVLPILPTVRSTERPPTNDVVIKFAWLCCVWLLFRQEQIQHTCSLGRAIEGEEGGHLNCHCISNEQLPVCLCLCPHSRYTPICRIWIQLNPTFHTTVKQELTPRVNSPQTNLCRLARPLELYWIILWRSHILWVLLLLLTPNVLKTTYVELSGRRLNAQNSVSETILSLFIQDNSHKPQNGMCTLLTSLTTTRTTTTTAFICFHFRNVINFRATSLQVPFQPIKATMQTLNLHKSHNCAAKSRKWRIKCISITCSDTYTRVYILM